MDLGAVLVSHHHALGGSGVSSKDHAVLHKETQKTHVFTQEALLRTSDDTHTHTQTTNTHPTYWTWWETTAVLLAH